MKLKEWIEKGKPINSIVNADCIDFLKSIEECSADLIISSCPYNLNIDYDSWNDNLPWNEYLSWCEDWFTECYRVLKDDGRICINHYLNFNAGPEKEDQFPLFDFREIQRDIGFNVSKLILWEDITVSKLTSWGSWRSASAPYIKQPYEGILLSYKNQWKKQNKGISTISKEEFMEGVSGVWKLRPETHGQTKANFPIQLPKRCINLLTYKGDCVIDMFSGSGTTAVAAIETERNYICGEISSNYCDIANKRTWKAKKSVENKQKYKQFFGE